MTDVQIVLSWTKVSEATSYVVHHKLATESDWIDSDDLGDVDTATISGLTASTLYDVSISAVKDTQVSEKAETV